MDRFAVRRETGDGIEVV